MGRTVPRVLVVAGTHSGGGAGIETDLRVLTLLGVYGMTAVTAVNAQNTLGCQRSHPVPVVTVEAQIEAVLGDLGADVIKTGQLVSAPVVRVVAAALRRYSVAHVVVDPVLAATSGPELLDHEGCEALKHELIPQCSLLTPNAPEAGRLLGRRVETLSEARAAARDLAALGPRAVLIKGGHLTGDPVDVLYDGQGFIEYGGSRIDGPGASGTGCMLASAVAGYLSLGRPLTAAIAAAGELVAAAIRHALPLGQGRLPGNPWVHVAAGQAGAVVRPAAESEGQ